jgi:predicted RNase H-like HicB family nuclease
MRRVPVVYHWEPEGWWAESPAASGFSAAGSTYDELREQAREGLAFYFEEPIELDESFPDAEAVWSVTAAIEVIFANSAHARRVVSQATQVAGTLATSMSPAPVATLTVRSDAARAGG